MILSLPDPSLSLSFILVFFSIQSCIVIFVVVVLEMVAVMVVERVVEMVMERVVQGVAQMHTKIKITLSKFGSNAKLST